MKAITCSRFGTPDVLVVADIPDPKPGDGEALFRAEAASVNPGDADNDANIARYIMPATVAMT